MSFGRVNVRCLGHNGNHEVAPHGGLDRRSAEHHGRPRRERSVGSGELRERPELAAALTPPCITRSALDAIDPGPWGGWVSRRIFRTSRNSWSCHEVIREPHLRDRRGATPSAAESSPPAPHRPAQLKSSAKKGHCQVPPEQEPDQGHREGQEACQHEEGYRFAGARANNHYSARSGKYTGAWQFDGQTWRSHGGKQFSKEARNAPKWAQDYVMGGPTSHGDGSRGVANPATRLRGSRSPRRTLVEHN